MNGVNHMQRFLMIIFLALGVTACSQDQSQGSAPASANSGSSAGQMGGADSMPSDPELARIYRSSCYSCHRYGAGGAPQTGNEKQWQARMEKGMDALMESTINGYRGMPPMGACMDCGEAEFHALIRFMAGQSEGEY